MRIVPFDDCPVEPLSLSFSPIVSIPFIYVTLLITKIEQPKTPMDHVRDVVRQFS